MNLGVFLNNDIGKTTQMSSPNGPEQAVIGVALGLRVDKLT